MPTIKSEIYLDFAETPTKANGALVKCIKLDNCIILFRLNF